MARLTTTGSASRSASGAFRGESSCRAPPLRCVWNRTGIHDRRPRQPVAAAGRRSTAARCERKQRKRSRAGGSPGPTSSCCILSNSRICVRMPTSNRWRLPSRRRLRISTVSLLPSAAGSCPAPCTRGWILAPRGACGPTSTPRSIAPTTASSTAAGMAGPTCRAFADFRKQACRTHPWRLLALIGRFIPETVASRADCEERIRAPMYRDITPLERQGVLRHDGLNCHGAIARFDRQAIEIRVIDLQECPQAEVTIAAATVAVVKYVFDAAPESLEKRQAVASDALADIPFDCVRDAGRAVIDDAAYLRLLGFTGARCEVQELWRHLIDESLQRDAVSDARRAGGGGPRNPASLLPAASRQGGRRDCRCGWPRTAGDPHFFAQLHARTRRLGPQCRHRSALRSGAARRGGPVPALAVRNRRPGAGPAGSPQLSLCRTA